MTNSLKQVLHYIEKGVRVSENALAVLCGALFMIMLLLGTGDVIGRFVFNHPITGTLEFSTVLMAGIVLLGWAYTQNQGGHIRVDIILGRYPSRLKALVDVLGLGLSLLLFMAIAWASAQIAIKFTLEERMFQTIDLPIGYAYFMVPLGSIFICLEFVIQMIYLLPKIKGSQHA